MERAVDYLSKPIKDASDSTLHHRGLGEVFFILYCIMEGLKRLFSGLLTHNFTIIRTEAGTAGSTGGLRGGC